MELKDLVITSETALALKNAGVVAAAHFSYYRSEETLKLKATTRHGRPFHATAYTANELMDMLPGGLDIQLPN